MKLCSTYAHNAYRYVGTVKCIMRVVHICYIRGIRDLPRKSTMGNVKERAKDTHIIDNGTVLLT
jgi:hypothetical protein